MCLTFGGNDAHSVGDKHGQFIVRGKDREFHNIKGPHADV